MKTFAFIIIFLLLLRPVGDTKSYIKSSDLVYLRKKKKNQTAANQSCRGAFLTFPRRQNKTSWKKPFPWLSVKKPGFSADPISSSCAVTICAERCTPARLLLFKTPWFQVLPSPPGGSLQNLSLMSEGAPAFLQDGTLCRLGAGGSGGPQPEALLYRDDHQYSSRMASEDSPATCKLGQFLHYLGDLYLAAVVQVGGGGRSANTCMEGPHLHFDSTVAALHTTTTCGILNSIGKRRRF